MVAIQRREHSWDGYVRYIKVFIFYFISVLPMARVTETFQYSW
jgi:hypothetical protein